jgi:hypothetical protein
VEVDQDLSLGKTAREDQYARSHSSTGGVDLQHVRKSTFVNLGDPWVAGRLAAPTASRSYCSKEVRLHRSTDEASNDRGGKGVAERSNANGEIGTTHRGGELE